MFKMVSGKVSELEAKMNAAVAEGFTHLFREFPDSHSPMLAGMYVPGAPPPEPSETVYHFLMQKPLPSSMFPPVDDLAKFVRQGMVAMGMGDRLPPEPDKAKILEIVKKEP